MCVGGVVHGAWVAARSSVHVMRGGRRSAPRERDRPACAVLRGAGRGGPPAARAVTLSIPVSQTGIDRVSDARRVLRPVSDREPELTAHVAARSRVTGA